MNLLQPGDLLLWRVTPDAPWIDRLIGWGEYKLKQSGPNGYQYYHVAFAAANPKFYYSSQPPKIDKFTCPLVWPSNVEQWRFNIPLTIAQSTAMFQYAESRRGEWYPLITVASMGIINIGNLEDCSQFTEDWAAHGNIALSPDVQFTTPDAIASSPLIQRIDV